MSKAGSFIDIFSAVDHASTQNADVNRMLLPKILMLTERLSAPKEHEQVYKILERVNE